MLPPESNRWTTLPPVPAPARVLTEEQVAELLERGRAVVRDAAQWSRRIDSVFTLGEWNLVLR